MKEEYKIWKKRDLSELKVVYLILDAIRVPMRIGGKGLDSVMVAYGVLEDGSFETLSLTVKNSESDLAWRGFVIDTKDRGLKDPLLVVSDGNQGLILKSEDGLIALVVIPVRRDVWPSSTTFVSDIVISVEDLRQLTQ